jgi:hypothetical protein
MTLSLYYPTVRMDSQTNKKNKEDVQSLQLLSEVKFGETISRIQRRDLQVYQPV